MRGRRLFLVGLACGAAILLVAGCGDTDDDTRPGPHLLDDVETEVVATVTVDDGFSDTALSAEPGQAIEFTNEGADPVRIIGYREDDQLYDTGDLLAGENTIVVFDTVDPYTFKIEDADTEPLRVTVAVGPTSETEETPATEAGDR